MGVLYANVNGVWEEVKGGSGGGGGAAGPAGPTGPAGADGATGPAGPTAVSADVGNQAVLGTDGLIFVPEIAPPFPNTYGEEVQMAVGGGFPPTYGDEQTLAALP